MERAEPAEIVPSRSARGVFFSRSMSQGTVNVAIIGGGVAGLSLGAQPQKAGCDGLSCVVFETAPEIKELGVGITLLPHAMRELAMNWDCSIRSRPPGSKISKAVSSATASASFSIRSRAANMPVTPIPRSAFIAAVCISRSIKRHARGGRGRRIVLTDRQCIGVEQDDAGVTIRTLKETSSGKMLDLDPCRRRDRLRRYQFRRCAGSSTPTSSLPSRGSIPGAASRASQADPHRALLYAHRVDPHRQDRRLSDHRRHRWAGNQLINWMAEIQTQNVDKNDWNKPGKLEDFLPIYQNWKFDWLDVGELIRNSETILEYPMVDKDPGRALDLRAHHPHRRRRPSDVSARVERLGPGLDRSAHIGRSADPATTTRATALKEYEAKRLATTSPTSCAPTASTRPISCPTSGSRSWVGDKPYDDLEEVITQAELKALGPTITNASLRLRARSNAVRAWPSGATGAARCRIRWRAARPTENPKSAMPRAVSSAVR